MLTCPGSVTTDVNQLHAIWRCILRFKILSLLVLLLLVSAGLAIWQYQLEQRKIQEEQHIFENILSGHKQMFLMAMPQDNSWPIFLKFDGENVVVCSNHHSGWCYETPGAAIETLRHITVSELTPTEVELSFRDQTKIVKLDDVSGGHYYGR